MNMRIRNGHDATDLDRMAYRKANGIAEGHGLRDRAVTSFRAMADELLSELGPVIETQARAEADQAAKARLKEILGLPEAEGRRDLAESLALETDTPADQCRAILKASPRQHQHDPLAAIMRGNTPGISSDDGDPDAIAEADEIERAANHILTAGGARAADRN